MRPPLPTTTMAWQPQLATVATTTTATLQLLLLLSVVTMSSAAAAAGEAPARPITLPGCPDRCGNISIPYPFGTREGCYFGPSFFVGCNLSHTPAAMVSDMFIRVTRGYYMGDQDNPEAIRNSNESQYLTFMDMGLLGIDVAQGVVRASVPPSSDCGSTNKTFHALTILTTSLKLSGLSQDWPTFLFSSARNVLVGVGQNVEARLVGSMAGTDYDDYEATCRSLVDVPSAARNGSCLGLGCCSAELPPGLARVAAAFRPQRNSNWTPTFPCSYSMLVERSWYNFSSQDLYGRNFEQRFPDGVPVAIDFAIRNESCPAAGGRPLPLACRSSNSVCVNATLGPGYLCKCKDGYDGNPYIPDGCQDIDECMLRDAHADLRSMYPCYGICKNTIGSYDCKCKLGMRGDAKNGTCEMVFPLPAMVATFGLIGVASAVSIVILFKLLLKEKRKTKEFFLKNGGPTLEKVNTIKIFQKEELKPIIQTRNVIGKGGFGQVYKGILDNHQVAVKKSINVDKSQEKQFANEIIIQSRVIHKNIIKLIGCCLEVDVPMLVYEFVQQGSLDDILHNSPRVSLGLDIRLNIAVGAAEGLAYMHSKTSTSILHGDIKPGNILLDENFEPKISDFGISRLIAMDKSHTKYVIGDMGYVDPIYIQSGLLTKQSDVYSFGVVLLELLTRKKAPLGQNNSLIRAFLDAYTQENGAIHLFDTDIIAEKDMGILHGLCVIISECLKLEVDKRPEMTDVAEQLQILKKAYKTI